jgi:hypothetical protein
VLYDEGSIEISGRPPYILKEIQTKLENQQKQSDDGGYVSYTFDIPVELFVALGGERYDGLHEHLGKQPWQILETKGENIFQVESPKPVSMSQKDELLDVHPKSHPPDRQFYDLLGEEDLSHTCKYENCTRGSIKISHFCKKHHYELIIKQPYPFED